MPAAWIRVLRCVACSLALAGCALGDPPARDEIARLGAANLAIPTQWASAADSGDAVGDNWLSDWGEPALSSLVAEALRYNADLQLASARVEQAVAYLQAAGSQAYPQINFLARGGGKMGGDSTGLQGIGLFANWELDLWGRVRAGRNATQMQYESVALDAEYARQSIAALVAKSWILAIEARLAKERALQMQGAADQLASFAGDRLRVGKGDDFEMALAQANVESYRDTERALDLGYTNALRALEMLLGRYPAAAVAVAPVLPGWPGDVPLGLPSELLERRPDVMAAERRVAAAFYRIEEAKAARLPRISLVGSVTTLSSEMFVLKDRNNPVASIGANLLQPVFLGGYLQSQVDARTAEQRAAVADYGRTSIKVFGEVEGVLSAGFAASEREQILRRAERDNARALELANVRFRVGSGDLRGVQQQQLSVYSVQVALLRVQADRLVQRINLHLALGGSFEPATPSTTTGALTGIR